MNPSSMEVYARLCGWTLARGHARSGDRIAIAAYLGTGESFDKAIAEFAVAYADQNERDYAAVTEALQNVSTPLETSKEASEEASKAPAARS
jgi:predicted alpha/beta hydrolase